MKLIGLFVSIGLISMFLMFAYFLKSKFSDDESTVVKVDAKGNVIAGSV